LGGEDPQLKKITQRQQLLGMIDPSNPDSYAQAIQAALQTGDQEAAFLLRNEMMKAKEQAQQQEIRGFEREKLLLDRGLDMKQRIMEARALSIANGIDPDTGLKGKSILNEQGEVVDTQALKPLFDPTTKQFNQDVANTLISEYGQVGVNIVNQRLQVYKVLRHCKLKNLLDNCLMKMVLETLKLRKNCQSLLLVVKFSSNLHQKLRNSKKAKNCLKDNQMEHGVSLLQRVNQHKQLHLTMQFNH
jgi:hypothetical protein